jgi:hypothetical protein
VIAPNREALADLCWAPPLAVMQRDPGEALLSNPSEYRSRAQAAEAAASCELPGFEQDQLLRHASALYEIAERLESHPPSEAYRQQSEVLLRRAGETQSLRQRSLLITEAAYWHNLAITAEDDRDYAAQSGQDDASAHS